MKKSILFLSLFLLTFSVNAFAVTKGTVRLGDCSTDSGSFLNCEIFISVSDKIMTNGSVAIDKGKSAAATNNDIQAAGMAIANADTPGTIASRGELLCQSCFSS